MIADPSIEIVLAVRNEEKHLGACLEALCSQDLPPSTIFVVDNNSTDRTLTIAKRFQLDHSKIRIIHSSATTVSGVRNDGLKQCCGEFVGFLDGHSVPAPNWLSSLYKHLDSQPQDVAGCVAPIVYSCRSGFVSSYIRQHSGFTKAAFFRYFLSGSESSFPWLPSGAALFRRTPLVDLGCFNDHLTDLEDAELSWRLLQSGYRFAFCGDTEVDHREERGSFAFAKKLFQYGYSAGAAGDTLFPSPERHHQSVVSKVSNIRIRSVQLFTCIYAVGEWWGRRQRATRSRTFGLPIPEPTPIHRQVLRVDSDVTLLLADTIVFWSAAEDGSTIILLDLASRCRQRLDGVSADIWWSLFRGASRSEIVQHIATAYQAEVEEVATDLDAFIEALIAQRILRRVDTLT